ncbi:DUF2845 domain-containing protein [Geobacter sulfurreducens]|uniref:Uncharacterized protein n=1 Tax=Geobacter sulfurreducens (strain ATCC 51573 / DSM 12127 / PCA) TaxID=243231 RepID=Q74CX7_GEOSL|nr:DUF2845 domain-containing protein [Geobacter sulfurreducens]AAR34918.1 protein of unknown function DUF2845 [Geobacter sulfurreducens PCA]ADI84380.2 protein of unknown function DUF2845 [Geobacter sulfurreducens KN400]AJY71572.1 hypothetical protein RW64_19475 [Geobacter sulfurreducens]UAC05551.1 DUF2845 domain-containing protein [Geobacter sulfurreducens]
MKRLTLSTSCTLMAVIFSLVFTIGVTGARVEPTATVAHYSRKGDKNPPPAKAFPILREPGSTTAKFYCGDRIVAPGDTRAGVIEKCGEPARKEQRREERVQAVTRDGTFLTTVTTEEWVYNFGPDRFLYHLKFLDDRLVEIRTGEYGY